MNILKISLVVIAGLGLSACQKASPPPDAYTANRTNLPPAAPNTRAGVTPLEKFCDFENGRCQSPDTMVWQLRLRLKQLDDYTPAVQSQGQPVAFLKDWSNRYRSSLGAAEARFRRQGEIARHLNEDYDCRLRQYTEGEQMTFGRELSDAHCQPLRATNYAGAAGQLRELAAASLPEEARQLKIEAAHFEELGPLVSDLSTLKQEILSRGILRFDPPGSTRLKVAHVGHPFEKSNEVRWLQAYAYNVRKLSKRWGDLTQSYPTKCLEPACDPEFYKLAEAADYRPPLDWGFLRDGEHVVAPAPYALSYFGQRYSANGEVREALGLNLQRSWVWNSERFQSHLPQSRTLNFARMFPREGVSLTITNYGARTEYTNVLPLFLTFQEARGVLEVIGDVRKQEVARLTERHEEKHGSRLLDLIKTIHEIRFDPFAGPNYVSLEPSDMGFSVVLRVLQPREDRPIEAVRADIYRELPELLQAAALTL